jgi:hypothetical protein
VAARIERRQLRLHAPPSASSTRVLPDALLATDTAGRYAAYKTGLEAGFLTIDEVRRKENLPALTERVPAIG